MSNIDFPSVSSDEIRTARITHKCCECKDPILPGQKISSVQRGCYERNGADTKTCMDCNGIRHELSGLYRDDEGPAFGVRQNGRMSQRREFAVKGTRSYECG